MNKYTYFSLIFIMLFSGCSTYTVNRYYDRAKIESGKDANIDRLFNAAMQILNAQNYSITKSQRSEGLIVGSKLREVTIVINENMGALYLSISAGVSVSDQFTEVYDPCPGLKEDILLLYKKFSGHVVPDPISKYYDKESDEIRDSLK